MRKLDRIAASCIVLLLAATGCLLLLNVILPIRVSCINVQDNQEINPAASISFRFSRAVQPAQVEALLQINVNIKGTWTWLNAQQAEFKPVPAWPSGQTIRMQFLSGTAGVNGEKLDPKNIFNFQVRNPSILALGNIENGQELFLIDLQQDTPPKQFTFSNGQIYDFKPSPDGEWVAFSMINEQEGVDLWQIKRDGSAMQMILDCAQDRCSTPAWAPDASELAYSRESTWLGSNTINGTSRIWILDPQSGQTALLFSDTQKTGYGPEWSPDGEWLAFWDDGNTGIQIVNRSSGASFLLEAANGAAGCWAADSSKFFFSKMIAGEAMYHTVILQADLASEEIKTIFGGTSDGDGLSIDHPVCNPADAWIAVTTQPNVMIAGRALKLMNPETGVEINLSDNLALIPSNVSWTPDGQWVVYQTSELGNSLDEIEMKVWNRNTSETMLLAKGFRNPAWLP
jgi:TolB protein